MEGHGFAIAARQHQTRALAFLGTDGAEDIGRAGALIARCTWPGAAFGPSASDLVLLPDAGLILEPNLYVLALGLLGGNLCQQGGELFLNATTALAS